MINNTMDRRHFTLLLGLASAAVVTPSLGGALAMEAKQVVHNISKADRLGMLAERVAKAVALIRLDIKVDEHLTQMSEAHDEFDDIINGFLTGEGDSGVTKERIYSIEKQVKHIASLWDEMRVVVEKIVEARAVSDEHFEWVETHDVEIAHAAHGIVKSTEEAYGDKDIDLSMAVAVDLVAGQRAMTQTMAKDLALASLGYHAEESHADFEKTCVRFGKIIDVLITGGANIMTIAMPPSTDAEEALARLKAHWVDAEELAKELHATPQPEAEKVALFAQACELLLAECDEATHAYEAAL